MLFHRLCSFSHSAAYLARNLLYSTYAKSRTSAYQGVINVRFSENIVYVLNEWSPAGLLKLEKKSLLSANLFFLPLKDRVIAYIANTLYFYKNQYIWFEASWFCFRFLVFLVWNYYWFLPNYLIQIKVLPSNVKICKKASYFALSNWKSFRSYLQTRQGELTFQQEKFKTFSFCIRLEQNKEVVVLK